MIEDAFVSDASKINHDLNFLYLIARTVLSKETLEVLMYGEDFEEPSEEDFEEVRQLIEANQKKEEIYIFDEDACEVCGGYH